MKHQDLKFLVSITFLISSINISAQKENLDDLVPFRNGKYWGLVHHDMKEFYKPVFDTIMLQGSPLYGISIFYKSEKDEKVAKVVYKGKPMYLTSDKKLKPAPKSSEDIIMDDDRLEAARIYTTDESSLTSSFYADFYKQKKVTVKKADSIYQFYVNGNHLAEFDCSGYQRLDADPGVCYQVILQKKGKFGLANLEKERYTIYAEYDNISRHSAVPDWFFVVKNGLKGVFNHEGYEVVPVKYQYVADAVFHTYGVPYPFVIGDKNGFHFLVYNGIENKESSVNYEQLQLVGQYYNYPFFFRARKNGREGIVSGEDSVLVPIQYDNVRVVRDRFVILRKGKKYGFADVENNFHHKEAIYDFLNVPLKWKYVKDKLDYYLFPAKRNGQVFFVDCFGREFISK